MTQDMLILSIMRIQHGPIYIVCELPSGAPAGRVQTVHSIGAGTLFVCLPKKVEPSEVEELALGIAGWREELKTAGETTVVFRDSAFADDVTKTNASAILEQHGIENVRSL